jgi:hypothetical protein
MSVNRSDFHLLRAFPVSRQGNASANRRNEEESAAKGFAKPEPRVALK